MFAREFAARARTTKSRLGQIDLSLIWVFAAALTQAPGRLVIGAEREPFPRRGQALPRFGRTRVGRQGNDLFSGPVHRSSRGVHFNKGSRARLVESRALNCWRPASTPLQWLRSRDSAIDF